MNKKMGKRIRSRVRESGVDAELASFHRRVYVPFHEKLWHVGGAFVEAVTRRAPQPVEWPPYKREDLRPVAGW